MTNDPLVKAAIEYMGRLFEGDPGGHDAAHTMRVYGNALKIAENVPGCDIRLVSLAALLHDTDDDKLFDTEGLANARSFMASQNVPSDVAETVCHIIEQVSFSKNRGARPDSPEAQVVQDADRLDAIGAIGIARTFAYGGAHGRNMESTVDHFHEKLLLLKDMMNTDAAKKLAGERHEFMESFLAQLDKEISKQ